MEPKKNKKAFFDYQHLETYTAGVVLTGPEVKSVKSGLVNLEGSYVIIKNNEAWLLGAKIAPYSKAPAAQKGYVPDRKRKLLLTKRELVHLAGSLSTKGLTIVPLSMYSSKRLVKVSIALAKGKRQFDKRKAIKEKDYKRRLNSRVR